MDTILDITGDDIAKLSDSDLRTLIGRLCEEDCKANKRSPSVVTWGGHQDAKDGGLDVRVQLEGIINWGFIPRGNTGFQVKKPDMPAKAILAEMKPNGILRDTIKSLIKAKGSYIIVSSSGSTADKALKDRLKAMQAAVQDEEDSEQFLLDFYDRGRIATWVRTHPTLILWVQQKIGKSLSGWQPYGNWSQPGEEVDSFIIDEKVRLYDGTNRSTKKEIDILAGLATIRTLLAKPGTSVRLTGLSGVGKTRFVQALFEEAIGEYALNSAQVIYTDVADDPIPNPIQFLRELIQKQMQGVIVVDNCQPELHAKLTAQITTQSSMISLLTVEYDVRDDLPDETSVFRLEPASDELILSFLRNHFSSIGEVDAKRIADSSGGNARIAISLASTVRQGDTLSGIDNEALFDRLFWQRNEVDKSLKKAAEALSIVYSFEGTKVDTDSEFAQLGLLIGQPADELYRSASELITRNLIQSRHVWRALLPHAIANRLAKQALKAIPPTTISTVFFKNGSERLRSSFCRRLGFLHDSPEAISLVNSWLAKDGWLGQFEILTPKEIDIVVRLAPVSPLLVLEALERAVSQSGPLPKLFDKQKRFGHLLRLLAFDKTLFIRCTKLLSKLVLAEPADQTTQNILLSLFQVTWSGTHATIETRCLLIDELIHSPDTKRNDLGILLLKTALRTGRFSTLFSFDFGARQRDYGYQPGNKEEIENWYGFLVSKCLGLIDENAPYSTTVKKILADSFVDLWTKAGVQHQLIEASSKLSEKGPWIEAWIEVKILIERNKRLKKEDENTSLFPLAELLAPSNLVDQLTAYALQERSLLLDFLEHDDEADNDIHQQVNGRQKADMFVYELSQQLVQDTHQLHQFLPILVSQFGFRTRIIGRGFAAGSIQKEHIWREIRHQVEQTEVGKRNVDALVGFLYELAQFDNELANQLLDQILFDPILSPYFLYFQTVLPIDNAGVSRLKIALDKHIAPVSHFEFLIQGNAHKLISDDDLASLLKGLVLAEGGTEVAVEILFYRFTSERMSYASPVLVETGQILLTSYNFSDSKRSQDDELSKIASVCLAKGADALTTSKLCQRMINAIQNHEYSASSSQELIILLAENHSVVFLDCFLGSGKLEDYQLHSLFDSGLDRKNPLDSIPDTLLIVWCSAKPESRFDKLSQFLSLYSYGEAGLLAWNPIMFLILENAPAINSVLQVLSRQLIPSGMASSYADFVEARLVLMESLFDHHIVEVRVWAHQSYNELTEEVKKARDEEKTDFKQRYESFE